MNKLDGKAFAELMTATALYYDREMPDPLIRLYWNGLRDYSLDDVRRAISGYTKDPSEGRFLPKIAQIIERIEGKVSERAVKAWEKVHRAVRTIGPVRTVVFDEAAIHAALRDIGGFRRLCFEKSETMPFRQREFVAAYSHYEGQENYPYPAMFVGEGYKPELVLVGDRQKAIAVNKQGRALTDQSNEHFPAAVTQLVGNVLASMQEKSS